MLTQLNLKDNTLEKEGIEAVMDALASNSSLVQLSLGNTYGYRGYMYNNTSELFGWVLNPNANPYAHLTVLNLNGLKFGEIGSEYLAWGLRNNSTLTVLDLERNAIKDRGAHFLASVLETNTTLNELNLKDNEISGNGAQKLAKALQINYSLASLSLTYQEKDIKINNVSAETWAETIKINSTLTSLNLIYNHIDQQGAHMLSKALQFNLFLTELNIGNYNVNEENCRLIRLYCNRNLNLSLQVNHVAIQVFKILWPTCGKFDPMDSFPQELKWYIMNFIDENRLLHPKQQDAILKFAQKKRILAIKNKASFFKETQCNRYMSSKKAEIDKTVTLSPYTCGYGN